MTSQADTPVAVINGSALYRFFVDDEQMAHIRRVSITRFWTWMLKGKSVNNTAAAAVVAEGYRVPQIGGVIYELWGDSQVRDSARRVAYRRSSNRAPTV